MGVLLLDERSEALLSVVCADEVEALCYDSSLRADGWEYLREYAQVCLHAQRVLEVGLREFRGERQVNLGFSFAGGYVFGPIT